jgi:hypothetical protein
MAGTAAKTGGDPIKRLVERRHPDHKANLPEWQFLRQAIEGGPAYVDGNLFQHPKEDPTVYAARKQRAGDHHYNLTAQVLQTYLGYLFQTPPAIGNGIPAWLADFIAEADEDGRPLVEFAKDVAQWQMGYGIIWIGVDKPQADPEAIANASEAQEKESGLAPYAYLAHPDHVLDGKIERGVVKWLLVQEDKRDDDDPIASSGEMVTKYRLWTETDWRLISQAKGADGSVRWAVEAEGPNPVGRVPFVPFRYGSGSGFASPGLVADIAHLDRAIWNKASLLDEIHYAVTFPQFAIPYVGDLYEQTGEDGTGSPIYGLTAQGHGILAMGLHSVIPYASEAGEPRYVTPPNEPATALQASIDKMVHLLLGLALLDGEFAHSDGQVGVKAAASGISKAYTFEKLNRRLATIGDKLEAAFALVFELVALWLGKSPDDIPEGAWVFSDSFEVRSLAQDLEEFAALMGSNVPSATARAELWKRILRKALPKLEEDEWKKIEAEIDAGAELSVTGTMGAQLAKLMLGPVNPSEQGQTAAEGDGFGEAQPPGGGKAGAHAA